MDAPSTDYVLPNDPCASSSSDLLELTTICPTMKLNILYATPNNFLGEAVYEEARAFLQRPAAVCLLAAHEEFISLGYGCLIYDGYRPWSVTCIMWNATPKHLKDFVADPNSGSKHNRGCAVDLTLYSLASGLEVEMPGEFDEMSEKSSPEYKGGSVESMKNRDLLRSVMEKHDFSVDPNEWWHFNWHRWTSFPVLNISFEEAANQ